MSELKATYTIDTYRHSVSEHDLQSACISWARMMTGKYPELALLHSSLNGIPLLGSRVQRAKIINRQKAAGMLPGIPDMFLPVARRGYHGLFIEMKRPGEKPEAHQCAIIAALEAQGYWAVVVDSYDDFCMLVEDYLEGDK